MSKREGYLLIDHMFSPGLPEDLARKSGFDPAQVAEGKRMEAGTLTCEHCKATVVKSPLRKLERATCFKCMHYICDICAFNASQPDYNHAPFEKTVELALTGKLTPLGSPQKLLTP